MYVQTIGSWYCILERRFSGSGQQRQQSFSCVVYLIVGVSLSGACQGTRSIRNKSSLTLLHDLMYEFFLPLYNVVTYHTHRCRMWQIGAALI